MSLTLVRTGGSSLLEIPLVDPLKCIKAKLSVRAKPFNDELLPISKGVAELHKLLITGRNGVHGQAYNVAMAWNSLRRIGEYWKAFSLESEAQYLAYFNLPEGPILARLTVLVETFDRTTFMLAGESALHYLVEAVKRYQKNPKERREDYQSIFDSYCAAHSGFERCAFYEAVRGYVEVKYEVPAAKLAGVSLEVWRIEHQRKISTSTGERGSVRALKERLRQFQLYAAALEEVIETKLGKASLPKKPDILQNL